MARWSKCGARPVLSTVCGYGQSSGERPLLMWTATSWALIMLRNIISADSGNAHRIGVDLDNLDRATLPTASVTVSGTGSGSDSPQAQAQPQPQPPASLVQVSFGLFRSFQLCWPKGLLTIGRTTYHSITPVMIPSRGLWVPQYR